MILYFPTPTFSPFTSIKLMSPKALYNFPPPTGYPKYQTCFSRIIMQRDLGGQLPEFFHEVQEISPIILHFSHVRRRNGQLVTASAYPWAASRVGSHGGHIPQNYSHHIRPQTGKIIQIPSAGPHQHKTYGLRGCLYGYFLWSGAWTMASVSPFTPQTVLCDVQGIQTPGHIGIIPLKEAKPFKNLDAGDCYWSKRQVILGWVVDTLNIVLCLPLHCATRFWDIFSVIPASSKCTSLDKWHWVLGKLWHVPAQDGLFALIIWYVAKNIYWS